ncbi:MAG TPA: right-handed parallel beta-helix repeat-containing protein [Gammaproteobacteria bacterium]
MFAWHVPATAAVYYVDSVSGNDSNSGLATSSALRSISKVNSLPLAPGDSVLFRRGQSFSGSLDLQRSGSSGSPITIGAWDTGSDPVVFEIVLRGDHIVVENLLVDHQKNASDAIRIRGARNCVIRDVEVRNGTRDGIDVDGADGLVIDNVEIHHFLNGSYGSEDDSHGIAVTNTDGITVRNSNIHHVSGDSLQVDPNRVPGSISNNIRIEDSVLWTGPLQEDFNSGWRAGNSPGENAIDTKVLQSGYENEIRMNITLVNVTAYGWSAVPEISNRAAFNLKEKITAVLDRVTVYDSEIAFRVRGSLGNANTTIQNAVVYDVGTAIRAEDGVANLKVYNSTFGNGIGRVLQHAGASSGTDTWDWRNNAFIGSKPTEASHATNLVASASDFVAAGQHDYELKAGSSLIDRGTTIAGVSVDRDGNARSGTPDVGAYEYSSGGPAAAAPNPPILSVN